MHGNLVIVLLFSAASVFAGPKVKSKPTPEHCNSVIQMGIMNNLVTTGKLKDEFPNLPKDTIDFIAADFERTKRITEESIAAGRAAPTALLTQMMERTDLVQPVKGQHFPVQGHSDLIKATDKAAAKMAMEEEKAALALSDMGYKVKFNEGQISRERMIREGLDPGRVPDLEVNGKIFDIYTPASRDTKAAVQGVIDKVQKGQTHRVVINVTGEGGAPEKLREITEQLRAINPNGLHEVLAVKITGGSSELVRVFP